MRAAEHAAFDHVGVLVHDVDGAAEALESLGLERDGPQDYEGDGTRELYLGRKGCQGRLLLMEATRDDGPYGRALERRGPGLHHVCVNVPDLETFVESLWGSGWMLHPKSIRTIRASRTAWLARPGIGTLVEVQETGERVNPDDAVVQRVEIPAFMDTDSLFDAFPGVPLHATDAPGAVLTIGDVRVCVAEL